MALSAELAALQIYRCHTAGHKFPSGLCKPAPSERNIPDEVRIALYLECVRRGHDEYTSQPCDHLTDALAKRLGVCAYGPTPTVLAHAQKFFEQNAAALAAMAIKILTSPS